MVTISSRHESLTLYITGVLLLSYACLVMIIKILRNYSVLVDLNVFTIVDLNVLVFMVHSAAVSVLIDNLRC
jgi:hypothetical protein